MKLYIVRKKSKEGKEYKRAVLRCSNDLTGEEVYFSGFYEEFSPVKPWGKDEDSWMEGYAEITRDRKVSDK